MYVHTAQHTQTKQLAMRFELGLKKAGAGEIVQDFARYYQKFTVKGTPYQGKIHTKFI